MDFSFIADTFNKAGELYARGFFRLIFNFFIFGIALFFLQLVFGFLIIGAGLAQTGLLNTIMNFIFILLVLFLLVGGLVLGLYRVALNISYGQAFDSGELFSQFGITLRYMAASVLYFLPFIVLSFIRSVFEDGNIDLPGWVNISGVVLTMVLSVYVMIKFFFYDIILVDMGVGAMESLRQASTLVKGYKKEMLAIFFITALTIILPQLMILESDSSGVTLLVWIGQIIIGPYLLMLWICAYRFLGAIKDQEAQEAFAELSPEQVAALESESEDQESPLNI